MSNNGEYVIVPGTGTKLYDGTVVILSRLPDVKWIVHNGFFMYEGQKQKGWYLTKVSSSNVIMPLFTEDLLGIWIDSDCPCPPRPPVPPPPGPRPGPGPCPGCIYTPADKEMVLRSMITVDTLEQRDRLGSEWLQNGKIVRVNNTDGQGTVEYYQWNSISSAWDLATLGYRYMTRDEIEEFGDGFIVSVLYSDSEGALVVTARDGEEIKQVLNGVAHNPVYTEEDLTLRIPVFGHDDMVMTIPRYHILQSIKCYPEYEWPDSTVKPSIVISVTDGKTSQDIVGDATALYSTYSNSDSIEIQVNSETNNVTAHARISSVHADNALQLDSTGLYVDISQKVDKKQITEGYLLVADGLGGFVQAHNGVSLFTEGDLAEIGSKGVVTANLIQGAITAAVSKLATQIDARLSSIEQRLTTLEQNALQIGTSGEIVTSTEEGIQRSGFKVGGGDLSDNADTVATEQAVKKAISWNPISTN